MAEDTILATGRRKTSVAQIRLIPNGTGKVTVNGAIMADGQLVNNYGGGGAGGSVWISCLTFAGSGALARPSSSKKIADSVSGASRPPYSRGQCTPAQPPEWSPQKCWRWALEGSVFIPRSTT